MVILSRASDGRSASQCPLGAFATEMGYSRDVCFSPDNDHIERALTRLKSAKLENNRDVRVRNMF
jgi:hypothetical protein